MIFDEPPRTVSCFVYWAGTGISLDVKREAFLATLQRYIECKD